MEPDRARGPAVAALHLMDARTARPYKRAMNSGRLHRRAVALVAAYAMALQMLLSALVPVAPSVMAAASAILCSHDGADGTGQPGRHELPCAAMCAAMGHGVAGSLPSAIAVVVVSPRAVAAIGSASDWVSPQIATSGPQAPRGPPLA